MTEDALRRIEHTKRSTWLPVVEEGNGDLADSKFAGRPWLNQGEDWPICPNCNKPMQFFLQLDLDSLPSPAKERFGHGLLQFFYCTSREPDCQFLKGAYDSFAETELIRIVHPQEPAKVVVPGFPDPFPPRRITDWKEDIDYPSYEDLADMDIILADDSLQAWTEYPLQGEKLGGWPFWVQSSLYPTCPICTNKMELVFQIDSLKNIPYMWGDTGIGHIMQCPEHKTQLSFSWTCL